MTRWFPFVPERRLAAAVAAAAALWLLPAPVGPAAGAAALGVLALLLAAEFVRLPTGRTLTVAREAPASVGLGDTVELTYRVTNPTGTPVSARLRDLLPACVEGGLGERTVQVPARGVLTLPVPLRGLTRAEAPLGPVGARLTTALGLLGARVRVAPPDTIRVVPSMSGVRRFRLLALQHRLDAAGVRTLRRRGEGQGFAGLREYAVGDDPRHIDWKASAKRAKLITREFTIERSQTVLTLIDAGRGMTQLAGEFPRFEHALSSAMILTDIAAAAGDRVGTLVFDDGIRAFVPAQRSHGALQAIREAVVPVTASPREPDYASAFRFLAAHQRKRALVVLFTDVLGVRASKALLAHVARSAERHLALVVALRNDPLHALAVPGAVTSASGLFAHAAAAELLESREEALERMRRAGAIVLDVSPSVMTASVVNRYLELKARGAL
ncbi:MAG: DUF58 domain-containing protein [Gemmatimonadaceae bacterium]|nr:DUF58 domain-containing protein [Gemmatimonadaceae bacterium]